MSAVDVMDTIDGLRQQCESDRDAALSACQERGIEPVPPVSFPRPNSELVCDFWYARGMVDALQDLAEELELAAERGTAVQR